MDAGRFGNHCDKRPSRVWKKYVGPEIRIEEDKEGEPVPSDESHDHIQSTALNARERLEQLKTLREAGLITQQEYDQKRREIVEEL